MSGLSVSFAVSSGGASSCTVLLSACVLRVLFRRETTRTGRRPCWFRPTGSAVGSLSPRPTSSAGTQNSTSLLWPTCSTNIQRWPNQRTKMSTGKCWKVAADAFKPLYFYAHKLFITMLLVASSVSFIGQIDEWMENRKILNLRRPNWGMSDIFTSQIDLQGEPLLLRTSRLRLWPYEAAPRGCLHLQWLWDLIIIPSYLCVLEETREERTFRNWMNSLGVNPHVNHLYSYVSRSQMRTTVEESS